MNGSYDLMALSSVGVRITPLDRQPAHSANLFRMQATSAETNAACSSRASDAPFTSRA